MKNYLLDFCAFASVRIDANSLVEARTKAYEALEGMEGVLEGGTYQVTLDDDSCETIEIDGDVV